MLFAANPWPPPVTAVRALALGLVAAFAFAPPAPAAAKTVLRVSLELPASHHLGRNLLAFKEEVERESKGEIGVEIYSFSAFYRDDEVVRAVASGAIEMGTASLAQLAATVPAAEVFNLPFLFADPAAVRRATAPGSPVRQPLDDAILATGARVLWWQAFGRTVLVGRRTPVVLPEDLKGKKVRVVGDTGGRLVAALGGIPVPISASLQYLAYMQGDVDAGFTGVTSVLSRRLYEVTDHLTVIGEPEVQFVVLINERVWQGLGAARRGLIAGVARRVERQLRDEVDRLEAEAVAQVRGGIQVVELAPAQLAAWRQATREGIATFVERAGALGRRLVEAARDLP